MSTAQITLLGTSDAFSCGGRNNTCFYIRTAATRVLLDCGATALTALKRQGLRANDIDTVVLTHFHGDHFAGLPFLVLEMAREGRDRPLTLITPPGGKAKLAAALALFYPGSSRKISKELSIHYITYKDRVPLTAGGITVTAYPVIHTKETLPHGVRIEVEGKVIAYSGDTEWTDELIELARGADLFLCECTFYEKHQKGHLNYKTLQAHHSQLDCKRLLLTHFDDEMLVHLDEPGLEAAADGQVISL